MTEPIKASAKVYLASFAALLGALSMGLALGYTSPAFLKMEEDKENPILDPDEGKRDKEKSMIASILAIGALIGGLLGEPCNKLLGRRLSLIIYGAPFIVSWLLITFANGVTMLSFGRFLNGLSCGLVSGTAPTYVVEIAPPQIRGLLGTCFQVMVVIGILLESIFGTFMSWRLMAGVSVIATVVMSTLMIFMPETPQWLLSKGRTDEAEKSLHQLRSGSINEEFNVMTQSANAAQNSGSGYSWAVIKSREFYKPMVFALLLMFFQQFSGINAVLFYQGDIFKTAAPKQNPAVLTIVVNVAQVIATIAGSLLVDRLGRRILLLGSGAGHTISLVVFGIYKYTSSKNADFQTNYAWLALVSLVVFISSFSIGYGPIPWMMIPEFSSAKVRSMIASIATTFNWTCVFIVTASVKPLLQAIGDAPTYWIFAVICAFSCLFVQIYLPETKGKSSEQIQLELLGKDPEQANLTQKSTQNQTVL